MDILESARFMLRVGENLREARRRARKTLEEISEESGFDRATLSRWENGKRTIAMEYLPRLAAAYETTVEDIIGANQKWLGSLARALPSFLRLPEDVQEDILAQIDAIARRRERARLKILREPDSQVDYVAAKGEVTEPADKLLS